MILNKKKNQKGFTLIELLVVIAIIALLIGILLPALGRARRNANQLKDATQLRGIMQSMETWASDFKGAYPNPDRIDRGNATENTGGAASKNRTGAILGLMIHSSSIVPEQCVSAAEVGPISAHASYQFDKPQAAASAPESTYAAWDPSFKGSPLDHETTSAWITGWGNLGLNAAIGHNSFAHMVYAGGRRSQWKSNLSSSTPLWANRGPVYQQIQPYNPPAPRWELFGAAAGGASGEGEPTGSDSATLFIHGPENSWAGNVAYGDGHASFTRDPDPDTTTYTVNEDGGGKTTYRDNIFFDETDEGTNAVTVSRRNAYLRIMSKGFHLPGLTDGDLEAESEHIWIDGE